MKEYNSKAREAVVISGIATVFVFLTSLPYIVASLNCPENGKFLWMTFNIDDFCVYLSWTRQVADGHWLMNNLFTSQPQPSMQFNLFFALAGLLVRVTGLSPLVVLHALRVALSAGLIFGVWKLSALFLEERRGRILAVALAAFSSGFGWMFADTRQISTIPVDRWQPESQTFLSAYLNPLFLAALMLIVGCVYHLLKAQRTGKCRYAVIAGVLLLVLGNVHTYDLVPLGLGWGIYLLYLVISRERWRFRTLRLCLVSALMAVPSVLYQFHVYHSDEVFRLRANTPAPSPHLWCYLLGYGVVFLLACAGAAFCLKKRDSMVIPIFWAAACFGAAYLPFTQQRKFIMGVQIPLAILAAYAFSRLLSRVDPRNRNALALLLLVVTLPTNMMFLRRDIRWTLENRSAPMLRPYVSKDDWRMLGWIRENIESDQVILCGLDPGAFIPAFAGRRVYLGHWSETPDFNQKMQEWHAFLNPSAPDAWRINMLRENDVSYVLYQDYTGADGLNTDKMLANLDGKAFLVPLHREGPVVLYKLTAKADY